MNLSLFVRQSFLQWIHLAFLTFFLLLDFHIWLFAIFCLVRTTMGRIFVSRSCLRLDNCLNVTVVQAPCNFYIFLPVLTF